MDTCFIFAEHLTDTGSVFLKLSQEAQLLVPPAHFTFADIHSMQINSRTVVIESSENTSILSLELSWLPDRKARLAIPFALEDKLAQPINSLHFAFDKQRYQDNHYLVVVIAVERLQLIMDLLAKHSIKYDQITIDWFALSPQELLISDSTLLVHQMDFKGRLSGDLALNYLTTHPLNPPLLFQDSQLMLDSARPKKEEHSLVWIARRLFKTKPLNLCQGSMHGGHETIGIKKSYYQAGILCCLWLLSILLFKGLTLSSLNSKNAQIDEQIALIYRQFFPHASQVISPKFRIQHVLKGDAQHNDSHFWFLLNQLAKAMTANPLIIERLHYQNQSLTASLVSPDFASIERLKNKMKESRLQVKQTQASTRDQQVVATLEFL